MSFYYHRRFYHIKIILFEIQYNNQVIQTYQTRIIQGLKDIDHMHYQTFRFVKDNFKKT